MTWNIQPALYLSLTLYIMCDIYFNMFNFLQAPFLWILFDSSPLKSFTKYLPCALSCFASASPSSFSPVVMCLPIFSQLLSQLQELSFYEQKQPPQFVVSAGWFHLHHVPLPLHSSLRQDANSPSTISSAQTFPPIAQAGVNIEYGEYQLMPSS